MKGSSYRERDYAFGQAMLTLRITIGLTQAGLAKHLDVSRKAVGEWEAGLTYPKVEHLKAFITLAVEQQAFPAGREEEEVRTFWQAAHQKVLLDEAWLAALLRHAEVLPVFQPTRETIGTNSALRPPAGAPAPHPCPAGARHPGGAPGGRGGYGPHVSWLRGIRPAAAPDGRDRASELPAAHQPRETGRPRAAGRQAGTGTRFAPRPAGCRLVQTIVGRKGGRRQRG